MVRLIDADALPIKEELKRLCEYDHEKYITARTLKFILDSAPTVEAVPVVRCRECKYYKAFTNKDWCRMWRKTVKTDDYCSRGKKMDEVSNG